MLLARPLRAILCAALTCATVRAVSSPEDLPASLDQVVTAFQNHRHFMGAVLVAKGGKIYLDKGYGMADLEWDIPNTPEAKFRLGSITKQFTATSILQLAEQKKLSVQDNACKYFDKCPDAWKGITIHHLLTHTSGIPSYTDDPAFPKPQFLRLPKTPAEVLLLSKDKPLEFTPGTQWKYDNSGYTFLGVIIEKASGEAYADYVTKHIFQTLGMSDTGYDKTDAVLPHRASGYQPCGDQLCNSDYIDMSLPYSAGSLYSTVNDLYKWDRALYGDRVLSKASRDLMFTPATHDYGYGWMLGKMANHKQIGHGGGIPGFSTYIARFPDDDATVIVLCNNIQSPAEEIAAVLAGTLFGTPVTLPGEVNFITLSPQILDQYVGSYQIGPLLAVFTNENGHLMVQAKGQPKIEAKPTSATEFLIEPVGAMFTFSAPAKGKAQEVKLKQRGMTLPGKRVP